MLICCILIPFSGFSQSTGPKEAPEILTTDLVRRQKVDIGRLDASFVIYDDDEITEVKINGVPKSFVPANTLTIDETLIFKWGKNIVTIEATDERGNKRVKKYIVAYGVELEPSSEDSDKKGSKLSWKIVGDIQYNTDSNPNNDLGLPIDTGDITIEGQISDENQADTQTAINLVGIIGYGKLKAIAGYSQSSYSKEIYESLANSVLILGGSYTPKADEDGLNAQYLMLDISMNKASFAQYHIFKLGYQFGRKDDEDGTTRHLWGLVYNHKLFADGALDAGNNLQLGWEYTNLDAEKLDSFKSVMAVNTGSEGSDSSKYSGYTFDFDWFNKWNSGFLLDMGFGLHYKEFPNQQPLSKDLGDKRVDIPIRYSTSLGWAFNDDWSLKANYEYKVNVSTKSPYYKSITGLQLKGGF